MFMMGDYRRSVGTAVAIFSLSCGVNCFVVPSPSTLLLRQGVDQLVAPALLQQACSRKRNTAGGVRRKRGESSEGVLAMGGGE